MLKERSSCNPTIVLENPNDDDDNSVRRKSSESIKTRQESLVDVLNADSKNS